MKKTHFLKLILLQVLFLNYMPAVRAQFFNGDFSLGTIGCNAGTGWTTPSGTMSAQRADGRTPSNPWVDITPCGGFGNGSWIEQSVPMVVGNCYRIELDLASHCGWDLSDAGVYITLDGQPLGGRVYNDSVLCGGTDYGWKRRSSIVFTAVNNPAVVRFTGEGRCIAALTGAYPCSAPGALANPGVIAIDNIELVPVLSQPLTVSLGNDTVYCEAFTHVLDAGNTGTGTTYLWSTGDTTRTLTVSSGDTYWCRVTTMCGTASDTINIRQGILPVVNLGGDKAGCSGDIVSLQPSGIIPGTASYKWSTADTTSSITVSRPGDYWIEVEDNGCVARDTIKVTYTDVQVELGQDMNLCEYDIPVVLTSPQPAGATYLWSSGLSDVQVAVNRTGTYWLQVTIGNCRSADTIRVTVISEPEVNIGTDSIICEQFPLRIGTEIPHASYLWNTGETTSYIHVNSTNDYVLEVNIEGCRWYDTIHITAMPVPEIDLGGDRYICTNDTILLDAGLSGNNSYRWNTGDTSAVYAATAAGLYHVSVTTEHRCTGSDSVLLTFHSKPVVSLGPDTAVCEETPLVLVAKKINADSLVWSDGSTAGMLSVKYGGVYTVTGINQCGTGADTILVKQIFCDIWLPNAFTPNNDGVNDVFRVLGNTGRLEGFALGIYDRWGRRIFYTGDKYQGWDGMFNGGSAQLGTYVYQLQYNIDGKPYLQKGSFHLLR